MRYDDKSDFRKNKDLAKRKYNERQIDKFIKWSVENKGYLKYKELIEYQDKYSNK